MRDIPFQYHAQRSASHTTPHHQRRTVDPLTLDRHRIGQPGLGLEAATLCQFLVLLKNGKHLTVFCFPSTQACSSEDRDVRSYDLLRRRKWDITRFGPAVNCYSSYIMKR